MRIAIIGAGVMGSAIANAVLDYRVVEPEDLTITDPDSQKLAQFIQQGVPAFKSNLKAIQKKDVVLIAIKPQMFQQVLTPLAKKINKKAVVISIAAGISIETIQELLQKKEIVRVMPNTPALISQGMSAWFSAKEVSTHQKRQAQKILNSFGQEIETEDEDKIDAFTAVSGSGPAYLFLFMQGLIQGAIKLGLTEEDARKAVFQTILGGTQLALESKQDLQTLIENVTSKGGTTASARAKFAELGFQKNIADAMQSAYKRAKELAQN